MSTMVMRLAMSKKLSSRVRPGVLDARANPLTPVSALISDDFPTLERPAMAISTPRTGGSCSSFATPKRNELGAENNCRPAFSSSSL
jgi:hypothetical protein